MSVARLCPGISIVAGIQMDARHPNDGTSQSGMS